MDTFALDWTIRKADDLTLPALRRRVQDMIEQEALLLSREKSIEEVFLGKVTEVYE
jgi:hypothetical protein